MAYWDGAALTLETLDRVAADALKGAYEAGTPRFNYLMESVIIRTFLGQEWFDRHCGVQANPNFLAPGFKGDHDVDWGYSVRILLLAEMLFNLQDQSGFATILDHLTGKQAESGYAELQVGKVLKQAAIAFDFADPNVSGGPTCDLLISLEHGPAFGEIKSKSQEFEPTAQGVARAIASARGQLPKGEAGLVFVKLPQSWVDATSRGPANPAKIRIPFEMRLAALQEMAKSTRIKKVIFYVMHLDHHEAVGMGATHYTAEFYNPLSIFDPRWKAAIIGSATNGSWISFPELAYRWSRLAPLR